MSEKLRVQVFYDIRDARDLSAEEKTILYTVESRGLCWSTTETMAADCGMTSDRFRRHRDKAVDKRILECTIRDGQTNQYRVNAEALRRFVPSEAQVSTPPENPGGYENPEGTPPENPYPSPLENPETKVTSKGNPKGTLTKGTKGSSWESVASNAQERQAPHGASAAPERRSWESLASEPVAPEGAQASVPEEAVKPRGFTKACGLNPADPFDPRNHISDEEVDLEISFREVPDF